MREALGTLLLKSVAEGCPRVLQLQRVRAVTGTNRDIGRDAALAIRVLSDSCQQVKRLLIQEAGARIRISAFSPSVSGALLARFL